jgi:hypothetical protein
MRNLKGIPLVKVVKFYFKPNQIAHALEATDEGDSEVL